MGLSFKPARWASKVSCGPGSGVLCDRFAPYKALKLVLCGKLTFDERVVLHRVVEEIAEQGSEDLGYRGEGFVPFLSALTVSAFSLIFFWRIGITTLM